jgi:hypothetical protein
LVHCITGHTFETRHPSDDSDQVWFQLVWQFQRKRFLKKFTTYDGRTDTEGRRTPSDDKSSHDLWPGELKKSIQNVRKPNFFEIKLWWWWSFHTCTLHLNRKWLVEAFQNNFSLGIWKSLFALKSDSALPFISYVCDNFTTFQ